MEDWAPKIAHEARAGAEIIALVPNHTCAKWYATLMEPRPVKGDVRKRLRFLGAPDDAMFPNTLLYYGTRRERFMQCFADVCHFPNCYPPQTGDTKVPELWRMPRLRKAA